MEYETNKKQAYKKREILLQGVIDCIIEKEDGSLMLVDYKTDRLTKEELSDKRLAARSLKEKHQLQLSYYALAVERMFARLPDSISVYSLPLGDTVEIKD